MFAHEFMRNALIAGSFVGLACGLVGYFVVLRAQVFAGDALSHVAFTGALAAAVLGFDVRIGLFAATILGGLVLGALGERARADDVVIGSLFAWTLGLGVLFLSIFTTNSSAGNGTAGVRVLFGSIFGLSTSAVETSVALALVASALLLGIARPLLYATLDTAVAAAQGVPVRALGLGFLVLLGLVAAQASQAVGSLLLLGLLAAPAGAAHKLTNGPFRGLLFSAGLAIASVWIGLTLSYLFPTLPPSSMIIAAAVGFYILALGAGAAREPRATWRLVRRVMVPVGCGLAVIGAAAVAQARPSTPAGSNLVVAETLQSGARPLAGEVVVIDPARSAVQTASRAPSNTSP
ncbi:MAG: zinc/manganese transport system permease protein [Gaiellales bacterium]|nr:zinc/manganese transport system permease protein [Gaiellales bacterium]